MRKKRPSYGMFTAQGHLGPAKKDRLLSISHLVDKEGVSPWLLIAVAVALFLAVLYKGY